MGVNSDAKTDAKAGLDKADLPWRHWLDGSTDGPIARTYNVTGWPAVFGIDVEGRIRFRDLHGPGLESAVRSLLPRD